MTGHEFETGKLTDEQLFCLIEFCLSGVLINTSHSHHRDQHIGLFIKIKIATCFIYFSYPFHSFVRGKKYSSYFFKYMCMELVHSYSQSFLPYIRRIEVFVFLFFLNILRVGKGYLIFGETILEDMFVEQLLLYLGKKI